MGLRVGALVLVLLFVVPSAASAATVNSVAIYSDPGDPIGGGTPHLFDSSRDRIGVAGSVSNGITVSSGEIPGDHYNIDLNAPSGQALKVGRYDNARFSEQIQRPGYATIDIGGTGTCGSHYDTPLSGNFEIKDLATAADGTVTRLWLTFEAHCAHAQAAVYGEARYGMPTAEAPAHALTTLVSWPTQDRGGAGNSVPVQLVASAPVTVRSAAVTGGESGDFPITTDGCSGETLQAGERCSEWVRFAPSAAGARSAQLVISDSAGRSYTSDLAGYTWPGGTRVFVKSSDTTDWLGQGEVWSYSPAYGDSLEGGIQSTTGGFGATSANGAEHFAVWIDAPAGQTFTPGVVYDAVRNRGETPPYAGFDIGIYGHSCEFTYARFKFQSLEFGGSDGRATSYRIDFEVLCTQAKSPVQGTVEWQTTNPGPPWFGDLDEQPTTQEPDGAAGGGSAPDPARAPGAATSSDAGTAVAPTPSDAGAPADPTNPQLSSPPAATPTSKKRVRRRSRCHRRPPRHRTAKAKRRTAPSCGRRQKRTGRRR